MDPVKVGEGSVSVGLARRVSVSAIVDGKVTFAILGLRENDVLTYAEVEDGKFVAKNEVGLPGRGGTIPDAAVDVWQDSSGQIFLGWLSSMSLDWLLIRIISRCLRICGPDRQVTRLLSRYP